MGMHIKYMNKSNQIKSISEYTISAPFPLFFSALFDLWTEKNSSKQLTKY